MKVTFDILKAAHIKAPEKIEDLQEKILVPNMMLRRRLTRSARIAVYLAHQIGFSKGRMLVGTALGEAEATVTIFKALAAVGAPGPTDFQNSVHNTPASYLSILQGNTHEIVTLSDMAHTDRTLLKTGVVKSLAHQEPVALFAIDTLSFDENGAFGCKCPFKEAGVALLIQARVSQNPSPFPKTADHRLPPSVGMLWALSEEWARQQQPYSVEIEL